jgi:translation initiation factor 2 subunit 2
MREGARTTIKNFSQIAKALNRNEEHLYKYLVKSLGTAGFIDNGRLILQGKFTKDEVQKEINDYVRIYVLCKECGAPDTEFIKEERVLMVRCLACGAKHPVRNI